MIFDEYREYAESLQKNAPEEYTIYDEIYSNELDIICPFIYWLPYTPAFSDFDEDDAENSMMRQPPYSVARLLTLFETQSPQSFTQLEQYRIPRFFLRRIFRSVIGFVLRNVNVAAPIPQPVSQYAETLLNRLITSRPMFQNVFTFFGVPINLSRSILIDLITFVLNNLTTSPVTA